ncbi:MAG TPA: DUF4236 domain-containing protein [Streptomyces sp.]|nr:DUF4236 domain-containing protein [Streptomyces sp.]
MPVTYRKSIRVLPGIRLNINRKSVSVTLGFEHGPHYTIGSGGRRTTSMDLPGPLGWRHTSTRSSRRQGGERP